MHLWCVFYLSRPMFGEVQLDGLQAVINELLPQWSVELRAAENEWTPGKKRGQGKKKGHHTPVRHADCSLWLMGA